MDGAASSVGPITDPLRTRARTSAKASSMSGGGIMERRPTAATRAILAHGNMSDDVDLFTRRALRIDFHTELRAAGRPSARTGAVLPRRARLARAIRRAPEPRACGERGVLSAAMRTLGTDTARRIRPRGAIDRAARILCDGRPAGAHQRRRRRARCGCCSTSTTPTRRGRSPRRARGAAANRRSPAPVARIQQFEPAEHAAARGAADAVAGAAARLPSQRPSPRSTAVRGVRTPRGSAASPRAAAPPRRAADARLRRRARPQPLCPRRDAPVGAWHNCRVLRAPAAAAARAACGWTGSREQGRLLHDPSVAPRRRPLRGGGTGRRRGGMKTYLPPGATRTRRRRGS